MDRLSVSGFYRRIPHLIAEREGFFAHEGLEVDFHTVTYSPDHSDEMAAGKWDLSLSSADKMISLNTLAGMDYVIILQAEEGLSATIVGRPGMTGLDDLAGTLIASDNGTNLDLIRAKILRDNGIDENAYRVKSIGNSKERLGVFLTGGVDSAILTSPWLEQALDAGAVPLAEAADYVPQWPLVCGWGRREWIEDHRALMVRFIRALAGATDWALNPTNRAAAITSLMDVQKVNRTRAEHAYGLIVPKVRVNPAAIKTVIDLRAEMGAYPPPHDPPERFFDLSYWTEATS
jgi:NitT/TauT family transport system substrate-binding protein